MRRIICGICMLFIIGGLLCACGGGGSSGTSEIPTAPSDVVVMAGRGHASTETGNYAVIGWSEVSGATSYTLYYGTTSSIDTSSSHVTGVTSPWGFTDANVRTGTYYYFAVTASNANGESELSEVKRMAVLIPKTGQTTPHAVGDDGDLEIGIAWPSERFLDNGNNTVTDTLTGLMWQKYPNNIPQSVWSTAFNWCSASSVGSHTDWRMPNLREMLSLIEYSLYDLAVDTSAFPSLNSDIGYTIYWTSTTSSGTSTSAWCVNIYSGATYAVDKTNPLYSAWVWAVRDDIGAATAEVPKTGQTTLSTANDDGDLEKGVIWPSTRFENNGDGTVTDTMTGLMWATNALSISASEWASAVSAAAVLTTGDHHDWRLPNVRELETLLDMSRANPCLPSGHPFASVQNALYWTSTTPPVLTTYAWGIDLSDGSIQLADKTTSHYVWPVRGTQ